MRPLRPTALLLFAGLLCGLLGRCSPYLKFDSAGYLRQQYTEKVGAARAAAVEVPFELNDAVRKYLHDRLRPAPEERRKVAQIQELIFSQLRLQYSLLPTRNAVETYRSRQGNCLSFVNLFVGVGREQGLNPFYVEVEDLQKWDRREGLVVSQGHIVAGLFIGGKLSTFDFLPYRPKSYRNFKQIDDLTAAAHYYNNLGAEALLAGNLEKATELTEIAAHIAPEFDKALNNLGVCYARKGLSDRALEVYQQGLAIDPENTLILSNVARLYQQQGKLAEARGLFAKIEGSNTTNPFFYLYESELSLAEGNNQKALDYATQALRLDSELPEVHLGFVKVYMASGDLEKARYHLGRALKLDATHREALEFARLLGAAPAK
jgi:tetratricopeptide (TPR) repeat protein